MGVGKMTGPKKAAILLVAMGEEAASEVIKNLEDSEIQQVGYYMARFTDVSPEELDMVLEEFYNKNASGGEGFIINASADYVKNTLTKALGGDRAKSLVDNLSANVEESALESLKWLDPKAIANFITHEHPQTIALILAHLEDPEQTATVLKELPENLQADVVYRMAILESIQPLSHAGSRPSPAAARARCANPRTAFPRGPDTRPPTAPSPSCPARTPAFPPAAAPRTLCRYPSARRRTLAPAPVADRASVA